jgi:hypothetical protein
MVAFFIVFMLSSPQGRASTSSSTIF